MRKILILFCILCLVFLGACSGNQGSKNSSNSSKGSNGTKVMKLAVATAEDRSLTKGLEKFGKIVEEKTNGSIKVEVYPNGQLGGDREVFEALQLGTIQGTTMSTGPIAQFVPSFNALDLPFLFPNKEIAYQVLDGNIGKKLLKELESQNVIGLNYWENGFRHLTNNVMEVKSPEDLKGLKIRTLESEIHLDIWKTLGANPTPMAYTELFSGLQQGVIEGQENPVGNVVANKFYEVQKYMTKTGHVYNASPFLISKPFWDSLTDEEKSIIKEASIEARDYQRKLNAQEDEDGFKNLEKNGMKIRELTEEERAAFKQKVQPVYKKYRSVIGEDLVDELLKEIKELEK